MRENWLGRTILRGAFELGSERKRPIGKAIEAFLRKHLFGKGFFSCDDKIWKYNRFNKERIRKQYNAVISGKSMKVAFFTLTRDRLDYTRHCFKVLREKAGYPFDHFVVDNGSTDGTQDWLLEQRDLTIVQLNRENLGISRACNQALERILQGNYDLIIKFDNDCEVVSADILRKLVEVYQSIPPFFAKFMLSPRVDGLKTPITRLGEVKLGDHTIGITTIIGGIFQPVPAECYRIYRADEALPFAAGQDEHLTDWFSRMGGIIGYIEDLVVNHYETTMGQEERYPAYFARKFGEEKKSGPKPA
jgi:hypothetical protein